MITLAVYPEVNAGERLYGVRVHTPTIGDAAGRSSLPAGRVGSHLMRYLGPVLNRPGDGLPGSPEHGFHPRGVGRLGLDVIHGQTLVKVLRRFADHDWPWYSRLARAVGDHPPWT